jgi:hypothetical protein
MLTVSSSSNSGPNEVEIEIEYYILRLNAPEETNYEFRGAATLIFVEDSGYWYLKRWYDYRQDGITNQTWGKLKYEYVQ